MTSLGLGNPPIPQEKPIAPDADPVPRAVVLWVGVTDPVLANFRDRLPSTTLRMLECADLRIPHCLGAFQGNPMRLQRILYNGRGIGYGVLISEWMTILPKAKLPTDYSRALAAAYNVLEPLGLNPLRHLTDRA